MKKLLILFTFSLLCVEVSAQSRNHKLGFTAGGGFQNYNGDLGSAFKFKNETSYGTLTAKLGYYLNRSFDIGLFSAYGDYGFCQPKGYNDVVDVDNRCLGCKDRLGLGNLNSRLFTAGGFVKYKFNNDQLLKEEVKIKPYIYVGGAVNHVTDFMKMNCVNAGIYYSANTGIGFKYYLTERMNVGYEASLGYFTVDRVDFMLHGKRNDMYFQNTVTIGIDLF